MGILSSGGCRSASGRSVSIGGQGATGVVSADRPGSATSAERKGAAGQHACAIAASAPSPAHLSAGGVRFKRALVILAPGGQLPLGGRA